MRESRLYIILLVLLVSALPAQAQFHEIGVWGGGANYYGDLNPTFNWKYVGPAGGAFYRYNINKRLAAKGMVSFGQVAADDAGSSLARSRQRNLSFRSYVADLCATFEFNFFKYNKNNPKKNGWTPYIATGVGMFFFNPEAQYKGKWYYLQPLGTEGQNDASYSGVKKYKLYSFEIPLEFGFKVHLKKNWNINAFMSFRETFTDYLDDVSGNYPSSASLPGGSRGIAAVFSDRSGEVNGGEKTGKPGYQRGESAQKDQYVFVGIAISYTFMSLRCPDPGSTWPYR
ncbi:MAG: outer membrane beta-barrel protein [Bacteroidetes bacterium]|nr:outer membrane beta-barrel protein [Bacteroidota bacterium]MBS1685735.1 outer membrane beta-barrel protein [Bacteroidota bacterium]